MLVRFDPRVMSVQIICGSCESYTPTENIKEIQRLVDELQAKMVKFQDEVLTPALDTINDLVNRENQVNQSQQ